MVSVSGFLTIFITIVTMCFIILLLYRTRGNLVAFLVEGVALVHHAAMVLHSFKERIQFVATGAGMSADITIIK